MEDVILDCSEVFQSWNCILSHRQNCEKQACQKMEDVITIEYIYSTDLKRLLTTHEVTWSRQDSFCEGQYANPGQPEEFPSVPIQSRITMLKPPAPDLSFEKFNFDKRESGND